MDLNKLEQNIISKKTFLCLGLDTDIDKIPKYLLTKDDPVFHFNKLLVDRLSKKIAAAIYTRTGTETSLGDTTFVKDMLTNLDTDFSPTSDQLVSLSAGISETNPIPPSVWMD